MALPLSPYDRQLAHQALGVTDQELAEIEKAPFRDGEELLKKLKTRVRKAFKQLVYQYHPDHNAGDAEKTRIFSLLVRATKELYLRQARAEPPGMGPPEAAQPATPKWRVHTVTVPVSGTNPFMQANVRRPRVQSSQRPDLREQAARLGKMRP
jgi:hypothetical protein